MRGYVSYTQTGLRRGVDIATECRVDMENQKKRRTRKVTHPPEVNHRPNQYLSSETLKDSSSSKKGRLVRRAKESIRANRSKGKYDVSKNSRDESR